MVDPRNAVLLASDGVPLVELPGVDRPADVGTPNCMINREE